MENAAPPQIRLADYRPSPYLIDQVSLEFALAPEKRREVAHELSDVLMGVIRVADLLEINLAAAFAEKMALNRAKYPPEKVQGRAIKYTEL